MSGTSWTETTDLSEKPSSYPQSLVFRVVFCVQLVDLFLVFACLFSFFFAIALSVLQCDKILQTVNHVAKYVAFWFEVDIQIAAAKKRRLMLKILPCNRPATTTVSDLLVIITRSIHLSITKRASF